MSTLGSITLHDDQIKSNNYKFVCVGRLIMTLALSRYRTLTIYNVFFEQNKMAEGGIRNTTTKDSVGVSCFYSHKGPSKIHV